MHPGEGRLGPRRGSRGIVQDRVDRVRDIRGRFGSTKSAVPSSSSSRCAGTCTDRSCSASAVGPHEVTASTDLDAGTATAKAKVLVVGTEISALRLNPRSAQIRPDQKATFSAVGVDGDGNVVTDLTGYAGFGISPDGRCTGNACTASQLGMHSVRGSLATPTGTITDKVPVELIPKRGVSDQAPGEIAGIQVSPRIAQADAGAAITYIATGVDTNGNPVADLTDQTTFAMSPDGSCAGPTCVATTPVRIPSPAPSTA